MVGISGKDFHITSWGWHDVDNLDGTPPTKERLWRVTDKRFEKVREFFVIVPGKIDAESAMLFVLELGTDEDYA